MSKYCLHIRREKVNKSHNGVMLTLSYKWSVKGDGNIAVQHFDSLRREESLWLPTCTSSLNSLWSFILVPAPLQAVFYHYVPLKVLIYLLQQCDIQSHTCVWLQTLFATNILCTHLTLFTCCRRTPKLATYNITIDLKHETYIFSMW